MTLEVFWFYIASIILCIFAIAEGIGVDFNNKVKIIKGEIVDVNTISSENMKIYNSRWAKVRYYVDGKEYISENRVVVPMSYNLGDYIEVKYFIDNPSRLYTKSKRVYLILLALSILCSVLGFYINLTTG